MSEDPRLSERYRGLPREEPPRSLDDAILAASRRAVRRRRWYGPLAAAAVITLAIGVTLHVRHDQQSEEVDAVSPSMQVQETPKNEVPREAPARESRRDAAGPGFVPSPQPAAEPELSSAAKAASTDQAPAPASAPASPPAAQAERNEVGAASAGVRAQMARRVNTPEGELERIAELRRLGQHEEADKALAEFRKRYPDYRFSDEMKAKVERRQ